MKFLLPLLLLTSPAYSDEYFMPCQHVREVAEVVLEDPYLSERNKKIILRNLLGRHGMGCLSRDAND
jgi:hypothetical protein|tara:strand:- start:5344 stop:5544 length:201 start_codon:yes stop_codon:yes gene_type:complete